MPCDHSFRDSNTCVKCDVHVEVLKLAERLDNLEIALGVRREKGVVVLDRRTVPALAGDSPTFEDNPDASRMWQGLLDVNRVRRAERRAYRVLLGDVLRELQRQLRVLSGHESRHATEDGNRLEALIHRVHDAREAIVNVDAVADFREEAMAKRYNDMPSVGWEHALINLIEQGTCPWCATTIKTFKQLVGRVTWDCEGLCNP